MQHVLFQLVMSGKDAATRRRIDLPALVAKIKALGLPPGTVSPRSTSGPCQNGGTRRLSSAPARLRRPGRPLRAFWGLTQARPMLPRSQARVAARSLSTFLTPRPLTRTIRVPVVPVL